MFDVVVQSLALEGSGCLRVGLMRADRGQLPISSAGAHIDVRTPAGVLRQYSLCGDPDDNARYEICVKREPQSRGGSHSVHSQLNLGDALSISEPRNAFPLPDAAHYILIAGGIGVTPLVAMAHVLRRHNMPYRFHYYVANPAQAPFREEWKRGVFGSWATLDADPRVTSPTALDHPDPDTAIMLCGPSAFMDTIRAQALSRGWQDRQIRVEHFQPVAALVQKATPAIGFEVELARSGRVVSVKADQTIAQALLENGVAVPLSCEQGMCGACLTPVLHGRIDHRDSILTESEREKHNQIALCCSRASTPALILDL